MDDPQRVRVIPFIGGTFLISIGKGLNKAGFCVDLLIFEVAKQGGRVGFKVFVNQMGDRQLVPVGCTPKPRRVHLSRVHDDTVVLSWISSNHAIGVSSLYQYLSKAYRLAYRS